MQPFVVASRTGALAVALAACLLAASVASAQSVHVPLSERAAPALAGRGGRAQLFAVHVPSTIRRAEDAEAHLAWPPVGAMRYCGAVGDAVDFATTLGASSTTQCLPFSAPGACRATPVRGDGRHVAMRIAGLLDVDAATAASGLTFAVRHDDGVLFTVGATRSVIVLVANARANDVERRYVTFGGAGLYPFALDYFQDASTGALAWTWHAGDVPYDPATFAPVGSLLWSDGSLACGASCVRCTGATPFCAGAGAQAACVGCLYDFQCDDGARCAPASRACEPRPCGGDSDCGPGAFCANGTCGACATNEHCGPHGGACRACAGVTPLCGAARVCIGCRTSADCPAASACSASGLCVGGPATVAAPPAGECSVTEGCADAARVTAAPRARRGSCGCRAPGSSPSRRGLVLVALVALACAARRRRSRLAARVLGAAMACVLVASPALAQQHPTQDAALYRHWTAGQGGAPTALHPRGSYPAVRTARVSDGHRIVPRTSARRLPVRQRIARTRNPSRPQVTTRWAPGGEAAHPALADALARDPGAVLVAAPRNDDGTRTYVLHGPASDDGPVRADGTREVTHDLIELTVDPRTGAQRMVVRRALARDWTRHPALVTRPWRSPAEGDSPADAISEVYAVSDVHGHYDELVNLLAHNGLIEPAVGPRAANGRRWDWRGGHDGRASLVVLGDLFNRGPASLDVLDLVRDLAAQAPDRVIVTMGNQESELVGDPASARAWRDRPDGRGILVEARERGIAPGKVSDPRSERGAFVANLPVAARIGDGAHGWVFFHAGKTHGMSGAQLEHLTRAAEDINGMDAEAFLAPGVFLNAADAMNRPRSDKALDVRDDARRLGGEHLVMGHAPDAFGKDPAEIGVTAGRAGAMVMIDASMGFRGDGRLLRVRWERGRDGQYRQVAHSLDARGNARRVWAE